MLASWSRLLSGMACSWAPVEAAAQLLSGSHLQVRGFRSTLVCDSSIVLRTLRFTSWACCLVEPCTPSYWPVVVETNEEGHKERQRPGTELELVPLWKN